MTKKIPVTTGTGTGDTSLSAFDAALFSAGIANYNLIRLSSVIPEGFEPQIEQVDFNGQEFGYKLYVVTASETQTEVGKEAWAGIGWVVTESEPKKGLFVEHHGYDKTEVEEAIKSSLTNMVTYRAEKYGPIQFKLSGIKCEGKPVCALVAAIYESEGWK